MGCKNSKDAGQTRPPAPERHGPTRTGNELDEDTAPRNGQTHAQSDDPALSRRLSEGAVVVPRPKKLDVTEEKRRRIQARHASQFKHGVAAVTDGEVTGCFPDGKLFKIVKDSTWYFYNDTQEYEMHVQYTFDPPCSIAPLGKTTVVGGGADGDGSGDGSTVATVVVYPLETVAFVSGTFAGAVSGENTAKPLSESYLTSIKKQSLEKTSDDLQKVLAVCKGCKTEEEVLTRCLRDNVAYVDIFFQPATASLVRPKQDRDSIAVLDKVTWTRPTTYVPAARHREIALFRDCVDPQDIDQGQLGDCYLLSAVAALAEHPAKIERLFAHPLSTAKERVEQAIGAYRVQLNKHGLWHSVIVDDFIPTIGNVPCFARCLEDVCELWASLLEKAYAKVHGSYAAIVSGDTASALTDLTGFPSYRFNQMWESAVKDAKAGALLTAQLAAYHKQGYLITVKTPGSDTSSYLLADRAANPQQLSERFKAAGLALGHAYSVLDVRDFPKHHVRLLKIRNPWGSGLEWNGDWSDESEKWVDNPEIRLACNPKKANDGTFWMEWRDAVQYFDGCSVCFMKTGWHDYRVCGTFNYLLPSVVLEITVKRRISTILMLSQRDTRGLDPADGDATHAGILVSVCAPASESAEETRYIPKASSDVNIESPSDRLTFNVAREVAMMYVFEPSQKPYYIVPRIYEAPASPKSFVLSLLCNNRCGSSAYQVRFRKFDPNCKAFSNTCAPFTVGETQDVVMRYQYRSDETSPQDHDASYIAK